MAHDFADQLRDLAQALQQRPVPTKQGLLGFDGFVDEIIDVVATRKSPEEYQRIPTIAELGRRIGDAAGLSTNLEMVPTQVKLGGNGPIMANALTNLGMKITYIGCLGYPTLHPVFDEFAQRCNVISIAEPGHTDALEFSDGKVMLGKHQSLKDVRWDRITSRISVDQLKSEAQASVLLAALNWTMLPYLTEVWEHFLEEIIPQPADDQPLPFTFFDLCDPEKRESDEIRGAIETIQKYNTKTRPILGLNRKEATEVADAIGLKLAPSNKEAPLHEITQALGETLNLYGVVVHPTDQAAVYTNGRYEQVEGPYTSSPKLTTGAGDNFNAGFCLGTVMGFEPKQCLMMGTGVSGFYVRERRSPSKDELVAFLNVWADHVGQDF